MLGIAIGSLSRYGLSRFFVLRASNLSHPLRIISLANIGGLLAAGFLAGLSLSTLGILSLYLSLGMAGGFIAFSLFCAEARALFLRGKFMLLSGYVLFLGLFGTLMLWLGFLLSAPAGFFRC